MPTLYPNRLIPAGTVFGQWVVLGPYRQPAEYLCRCACGLEAWRQKQSLVRGSSLGCKSCSNRKRFSSEAVIADPAERLRQRHKWDQIVARCTDPDHPRYADYGGRGIRNRFRNFDAFCRYITQLPGWNSTVLSIDRIDNDGDYAPGNLRMASALEQRHNQRRTCQPFI